VCPPPAIEIGDDAKPFHGYCTTRCLDEYLVTVELAEDVDDSGSANLVLSQEHFNVFFPLVLRVGLCMRR